MKRAIKTIKFLSQELNTLSINGTVVIGSPKLRVQYSITASEDGENGTGAFGAALMQKDGFNGSVELDKANLPALTDEAILEAVAKEMNVQIIN